MAAPSQGHQGDPYAPDPGEYQIPYLWVPRPDETPISAPPPGPDAYFDLPSSPHPHPHPRPDRRRPRRWLRRTVLSVLAVVVLAGAGATVAKMDLTPSDLFSTSDEPTKEPTDTIDPTDTPTPTPTPTSEVTDWSDLSIGECAASIGDELPLVVDCDSAHELEVFATFFPAADFPGYPGGTVADAYVNRECETRFDRFWSIYEGDEDLDWDYDTITAAAWEDGTSVNCYLTDDVSGSLYGSATEEVYGDLQ
ncbi:septum formation family protein [Streptomyces sp. NPDC056486]|uniref:septum formation family protein n=1 Tax=Streptomyces sp. NPDC056486 TaxID=3345835 RepID=UPI00369E9D9C